MLLAKSDSTPVLFSCMPADTSILHGLFLPGGATVRSSAIGTKSESGTIWDGLVPNMKIIGQRNLGCGNSALNPVRQVGEMGQIGNLREPAGKIQSYLSHGTTAWPPPSLSFVQPHSFASVDTKSSQPNAIALEGYCSPIDTPFWIVISFT